MNVSVIAGLASISTSSKPFSALSLILIFSFSPPTPPPFPLRQSRRSHDFSVFCRPTRDGELCGRLDWYGRYGEDVLREAVCRWLEVSRDCLAARGRQFLLWVSWEPLHRLFSLALLLPFLADDDWSAFGSSIVRGHLGSVPAPRFGPGCSLMKMLATFSNCLSEKAEGV